MTCWTPRSAGSWPSCPSSPARSRLAQAAEVCSGGDQHAALEVIDRLAGKSLVAAEPAEDGTRYRLLDTVRYYAADRLAEAGGTEAARHRHAAAFLGLAERERRPAVLAREQDNFRAALEWSLARGDQAGPRLAQALGEFWIGRGLLAEGRDWLERALARPLADQQLRADLLRLLGSVLFEAGELQRCASCPVGRLPGCGRRARGAGPDPGLARRRPELQGLGSPRRWRNARRPPQSWKPKGTWPGWPRR